MVKQSASVLVTMLVGMLSALAPLVLTLALPTYAGLIKGITVAVLMVVTVVLYEDICKKSI